MNYESINQCKLTSVPVKDREEEIDDSSSREQSDTDQYKYL